VSGLPRKEIVQEIGSSKLLITFGEASAALSISRGMLRKLARNGQLKVVRIGRSVRISRDELLRLVGAGRE
jgi:excisionase family DNA binding protein